MSALIIFTADVPRLAGFYELVLGATAVTEPPGDIRLRTEREEVLIHSARATLGSASEPRTRTALKPVFDIASLSAALGRVVSAGGQLTGRAFQLDGLTRQDVIDLDGNVIQLRG